MLAGTATGRTSKAPFPGLRSFSQDESELFFGRESQSDELARKLGQSRFVAVVGTSGCGKSSLVRAGLLPTLEGGCLVKAGSNWRLVDMKPGSGPIDNLAAALGVARISEVPVDPAVLRTSSLALLDIARQAYQEKRLASDENLLILVDQFEELFRYKAHEPSMDEHDEKAAFVKLLLEVAKQRLFPVHVIITMRSDFLGDCARFRDLPETINAGQYLVPRMTREQRREAIEGPIHMAGSAIAPRLVQRILNDVGEDPDQLPVMQHALMRTWYHWRNRNRADLPVDIEDYEAIGTLENALSSHVDRAYTEACAKVAGRGDQVVRRIFQCLRERDAFGREIRRPTPLRELCEVSEASQDEVLASLEGFRREGRSFVMPPLSVDLAGEHAVDITHESLLRQWKRLQGPPCEDSGWLAEEEESRRNIIRLADRAEQQVQDNPDYLRGPMLQLALDWWEKRKPNAAWARRYIRGSATGDSGLRGTWAFLERSRQACQEEAARARNLRLTIRAVAGAVMLTMAGLILWGLISRARMKTEHQSAMARALAFASLDDQTEHPDQLARSTLYAIESVNRELSSASLHTLQLEVRLLRKRLVHLEQKGYIWGVAFSPDGRYLATASEDKNAAVYDSTGNKVHELAHDGAVWAVTFSRDGKYMATGGYSGVRVFDTSSWQEFWPRSEGDQVDVEAVAFSSDGLFLATAGFEGDVLVFDVKTGKESWRVKQQGVQSVAFSPDGRYLATGSNDRKLRVTELRSRHKLLWEKELEGGVRSVAFSPDSSYLAVGDHDGTARIFEIQGNEVTQWTHRGEVEAVAFSPDGRYLATGSDDGAAHVFDVAERSEVLQQPHQLAVTSVAFDPDERLASSSLDGTVDIVEVKPLDEIARLHLPSKSLPRQMSMTWDTKYIAVVDESGAAHVFQSVDGKSVSVPIQVDGASQMSVSDGGRYVALGGENGAGVFETASGQPRLRLPLQKVNAIDITPDGRFLATGSDDGLQVFDVSSRTLMWRKTDFKLPISNVAFSMDGQHLAVGGEDPELRVFSTERGDPAVRIAFQWHGDCEERREHCKANGIAFSRDGKFAVLAANDKTVRVIDVAHAREYRVVDLPASAVYGLLSEDDKFVATSSYDLMGRVYEVESSRELWHVPVPESGFFPLAFTSKDKYVVLATGSHEMVVERLLWRPRDLIDRACALLDRNLKAEEWSAFSKGAPPKTCAKLP
jgi:WD40 repeat protein/energy-coupling factor transporter ATP-binding protein EcfA2